MVRTHVQRIIIIDVNPPLSHGVEEEIRWICRCLNLDPKKNKLAFEIFLHLLDASRRGVGVRTKEITQHCHVTQSAVVYHMNIFMRSGLVEKRGWEYFLRGGTLRKAIEEIEADIMQQMRILREIAERVDRSLI